MTLVISCTVHTGAVRLFVAAEISPEIRDLVSRLPRPPLDGIRWTTPEQWHITLAFLGEVSDERIPALVAALQAIEAAAAHAELGPKTKLLSRQILCLPVHGLEVAAGGVAAILQGEGFELERRPFRGHLTLARARRRLAIPKELGGSEVAGSWEVEELAMMRSTLGREGSRYDVVDRISLSRPS